MFIYESRCTIYELGAGPDGPLNRAEEPLNGISTTDGSTKMGKPRN